MKEPFVPKEPGHYWWDDPEDNRDILKIERGSDGKLYALHFEEKHWCDLAATAYDGTIHPGPITPPQEHSHE